METDGERRQRSQAEAEAVVSIAGRVQVLLSLQG